MARFSRTSVPILLMALTAAGAARAEELAVQYRRVPADQLLTPVRAFGDATPIVKLLMAGLLVAAVAAVAIWALQLARLRQGRPAHTAFLKGLSAAGPLLGLFGAVYGMLNGFLGISNIRPTPTLTVVAPGIAEALLVFGIGLFAACVAVICRWNLEGRISRRAAA
jgi:biopolymer transport protein ExbB/TolQ